MFNISVGILTVYQRYICPRWHLLCHWILPHSDRGWPLTTQWSELNTGHSQHGCDDHQYHSWRQSTGEYFISYPAKLIYLNFQPLKAVCRDPQPQVFENYSYLFNLWTNIYKSWCLNSHFIPNNSDLIGWYKNGLKRTFVVISRQSVEIYCCEVLPNWNSSFMMCDVRNRELHYHSYVASQFVSQLNINLSNNCAIKNLSGCDMTVSPIFDELSVKSD